MKRAIPTLMATVMLILAFTVMVSTVGKKSNADDEKSSGDQWEYMVVARSSNVNFSASNNPTMRKEPTGAFAFEDFVLEQNLDKLGAKGWELVTVTGQGSSLVYYLKRKK